MRWNCPHCSVQLLAPDEAFCTGWAFSRCYKCGGFNLVRRSDVNVVKVDRAPESESVIQATAPERATLSARLTAPAPRVPRPPLAWPRLAIAAMSGVALISGFAFFHEARSVAHLLSQPVASAQSGLQPITLAGPAQVDPLPAPQLMAAVPSAPAPLIDQIKTSVLMAPERVVAAETPEEPPILIETRFSGSKMRAGPGTNHPIVGLSRFPYRYLVSDFNESWFKVIVPGPKGDQAAWIRSDQVRVVNR